MNFEVDGYVDLDSSSQKIVHCSTLRRCPDRTEHKCICEVLKLLVATGRRRWVTRTTGSIGHLHSPYKSISHSRLQSLFYGCISFLICLFPSLLLSVSLLLLQRSYSIPSLPIPSRQFTRCVLPVSSKNVFCKLSQVQFHEY